MNDEYKIEGGGIGLSLQGQYRVMVINSITKEIEADYGWHKNLILNQGMDAVASVYLGGLNTYGIAGTGSRPNSITSSTSQITQSGATASLFVTSGIPDFTSSYSTYTSSLNVGDVIQYSNGSQSMVTSIIDGFHAAVNTTYNVDAGNAQTFTIWKTSQVGMELEIKRSSTYLVGSSSLLGWNCGSKTSGNSSTYRRTYDFSAEVAIKNYTEVGVGWAVSGPTTVFSRILLPVSVSIPIGSQLRLTHDLYVAFTPAMERYITASISGWPVLPATTTYASESIQKFMISTVDTSGYGNVDFACLDPGVISGYWGNLFAGYSSTNSQNLAPFGTATNRSSPAVSAPYYGWLIAYSNGSYMRYKSFALGLNDGNFIASFNTVGFGINYGGGPFYPYDTAYQAMCLRFDQPQTKLNTQRLTLVWKWSWDRVLQ